MHAVGERLRRPRAELEPAAREERRHAVRGREDGERDREGVARPQEARGLPGLDQHDERAEGRVRWLRREVLEEAGEVWLAAEHETDEALAGEISQLLYWTQVLMIARGLTLDDIYRKL